MSVFKKIAINCQQATYLHEKKREGKLSVLDRIGLWVHLLYCKFCSAFFKQLDVLEKSVKNIPDNVSHAHGLSDLKKAEIQKVFNEHLKK